ncbi:MAG TPA: amidohydrolase family protein [Xanthobacteraceae bacterium]|nr:amidohydrolase family protein [Xanthobacteraceae bacterium]
MSGAGRKQHSGAGVTLSRREFATGTAACGLAGAFGLESGAVLAQAPKAREGRTLFKNAVVLSMDPKVGDFDRADVLVEGRKIVAVRPDIQATATVINAANTIVMPGFIDTHHHFYQSALRNVLANGILADYFRDIVNKATPLYRAEDAYIGVLSGALRSLSAGITNVTDLSQVSNTPEHSDAMVKAFRESGIRAVYAYSRGYGDGARFPQDVERLQKQHFSGSDQLVTLALATAISKEQWLLARKYGLRIYTHVVGAVSAVAPSAVIKLGDEGLMGPDNVYIHYTGATSEQMKRVKDTGGWLSLACPIEMTMRHGMPPLQLALDHGIRPSLSSDVETTMAADMFSQMRAAFTLQRAEVNERAIKGEKSLPPLLTAKDVLAMATIEGARTNGLEEKTGSLTPGKDADLILLRTDLTNVMPLNNAYGAIVTGMDTSNVDTVMVAGRILKQRGQLVGVDLAAHRKRIEASRDYLIGKLGWPKSVIDTSLSGH